MPYDQEQCLYGYYDAYTCAAKGYWSFDAYTNCLYGQVVCIIIKKVR